MAFTAVAAVVGAETVTATMLLAAVAEVGAAMTLVGAITGSKDLMKLGGTLGLVGGVGGMISSAASGATSLTGDALTGALSDASGEAIAAADSFGPVAGNVDSVADLMGSGTTEGIVQSAQNAAMPDLSASMPQQQMPVNQPPQPTPTAQTQAPGLDNSGAPPVTGPQTPGVKQVADVSNPFTSAPANKVASDSFFSKISNFAEKNKTLFNSGLQLVGGAFKGMQDASIADRRADLEQQRINQTSYGSAVSSFAPASRGIIAGARQ